jgi:hypothetical protein
MTVFGDPWECKRGSDVSQVEPGVVMFHGWSPESCLLPWSLCLRGEVDFAED